MTLKKLAISRANIDISAGLVDDITALRNLVVLDLEKMEAARCMRRDQINSDMVSEECVYEQCWNTCKWYWANIRGV